VSSVDLVFCKMSFVNFVLCKVSSIDFVFWKVSSVDFALGDVFHFVFFEVTPVNVDFVFEGQ